MTLLRQLPAAQTPSSSDIIPIQQYLLNVATGITTDTTCGITPSALLSGFGITATGSTTARTAAAWFSDEANVIAFGADPTGVLDSTAAIQAAINAVQASAANGPAVLSSGGGGSIDGQAYKAVYLPGGQYLVSGSLIISYPVIFRGAGPRATTIFSTNPATPVLAIVPQYLSGHNYYNSGVVGVVVVKDLAIKGATPVYTTTSDSQQINMMTDGHAIFLGQAVNNPLYARVDLQNLLIEYATVDGVSCQAPVSTSVCATIGANPTATFIGYVNARDVTISVCGRTGLNMGSAFDWRWFGGEIQSCGQHGVLIAGGGGLTMLGTNIYSNAQNKAWNGWYNLANNPPTPTTTTYNGQTVPVTPAAYNVVIYQTAGGNNTGNNTFIGCAIDVFPYGGVDYNVQQTFYQTRFLGGAIGSWNHSSPLAGNYPSVNIVNCATAGSLKFEGVEFEPPYSWSGSATGYVSTNWYFGVSATQSIYVTAVLPWGLGAASNKPAQITSGVFTPNVFSVRDFGATGAGIVDDTAAIQSAITAATTYAPASVYLPAGYYKTTAPLVISGAGGVTIKGDGPNTTSIQYRGTTNRDIFQVTTTSGYCQISDINLQQFGAASSGSTVTYGINEGTATTSYNQYRNINMVCEGGIYAAPGSVQQIWSNVTVFGLKPTYGIGFNLKSGVNMQQCTASGTIGNKAFAGVNITPTTFNINGMQMANCNFEQCLYAMFVQPNTGYSTYSMQFSGCYFDTSTTDAVFLDGSQASGSITRTQFVNCWFSSSASGSGIYIKGKVPGLQISNNQFYANAADGITVLTGATITGLTATGNNIAGNTGNGITIGAGVSGFNITGNTVGPAADFGANANGIIVATGASDSYVIIGNNCHGNTTAGLTDGGTGTHKQVGYNVIT